MHKTKQERVWLNIKQLGLRRSFLLRLSGISPCPSATISTSPEPIARIRAPQLSSRRGWRHLTSVSPRQPLSIWSAKTSPREALAALATFNHVFLGATMFFCGSGWCGASPSLVLPTKTTSRYLPAPRQGPLRRNFACFPSWGYWTIGSRASMLKYLGPSSGPSPQLSPLRRAPRIRVRDNMVNLSNVWTPRALGNA